MSFKIKYFPKQCKTQELCDKVILENNITLNSSWLLQNQKMYNKAVENYAHALVFAPYSYKSQKMYKKSVDSYPVAIKLVPEKYKTVKMCDEAVDTCPFVFDSVPDQYKTKDVSEDFFLLKYCLDRYKA